MSKQSLAEVTAERDSLLAAVDIIAADRDQCQRLLNRETPNLEWWLTSYISDKAGAPPALWSEYLRYKAGVYLTLLQDWEKYRTEQDSNQ